MVKIVHHNVPKLEEMSSNVSVCPTYSPRLLYQLNSVLYHEWLDSIHTLETGTGAFLAVVLKIT